MVNFLDIYSSQLEQRNRAIVFGDYNIDLLSTERYVTQYINEIKKSGYEILNKIDPAYCTRETSTTRTISDHVSTNINNHSFSLSILDSSLSDHKQLHLNISKLAPKPTSKSNYTALVYEKLSREISKSMSDIGQVDYFILEKLLLEKIEICKVQKTKILNAPQEDWINRHIINAINLRNNLWKQTNRSPYNEELQKSFKKEKEKVQVMIKTCKKKYYHKLFNDTFDQPKKLWQLINNLAMNKIKTSCALPRLMSDSGLITDGTKICNLCNSFFSSIGAELADKISYEYHLDTSNILMYDHNSSHDIILNELKPCDVDELNKIIADLDTNTSTGLDGISPKAIKCIKNIIVEKLAISINKCFKLGIFPDSLKVAKVSPIHKSGSKTDPGNYRPISVLPVISKIFERLLYNRLNNFLTEKKVLIDEQYGFRSKSNTTAAAVDLITKIKTQIDKKT
ncbi:hypothetical protein ABMA28_010651 [Loxostege sticticalis]|uniref:Reverse transcriptase domain-containing protein n=1 Tax=Loxostege sticticalis TaxID=481309 RepID=A0ABD0S8Y2_LOXSC